MKKVLVIQRRLTHYRVPFFNALKVEMLKNGMELVLAYGDPAMNEISKQDGADLSWATHLDTRYYFEDRICWQPFYGLSKDADVIVIAHENKLIFNLFIQWFFKDKKVILWGHGQNLQRDKPDIRDTFKRITACKADWWFGYTDYSIPLIKNNGYPEDRITILNNSIDTKSFSENLRNLKEIDVNSIRKKYGITANKKVGIFIGSLYSEKKIEFLLTAAVKIKGKIQDFELIIAGNGPDIEIVQKYTKKYSWIHYVGIIHDVEKALLLSISTLMLNPGLVGLGILDAFIAKKPMITTDCGLHSPEIAYLENNINGIMTKDSIEDYVDKVCYLLSSNELMEKLVEGCEKSANFYTVEKMAMNFCNGIKNCLSESTYR